MGPEAYNGMCSWEEEGQAKTHQKWVDQSADEKAVAAEAATLLPDRQAGGILWRTRAAAAAAMMTVAQGIAATAAETIAGDPREKTV